MPLPLTLGFSSSLATLQSLSVLVFDIALCIHMCAQALGEAQAQAQAHLESDLSALRTEVAFALKVSAC